MGKYFNVVPQVDPKVSAAAKWQVCRYSGEDLETPVVVDELGNLFNKGSVLEGMLTKSLPPHLAHITSVSHLIDAKLEENPSYAARYGGHEGTKALERLECQGLHFQPAQLLSLL